MLRDVSPLFVNGQPKQWAKWLPWAEFCYNTSPHSSTKMTPFKALYGHDPPPLILVGCNHTNVDTLQQSLEKRDIMINELKVNLHRAQNKMKLAADGKRSDVQFEVGEMVYLKLQPYRQQSLARRLCEKLSPRYYGPYKVLTKVGKVAYKLALPKDCKIHPVFHVSQLKRAYGQHLEIAPYLLNSVLIWS